MMIVLVCGDEPVSIEGGGEGRGTTQVILVGFSNRTFSWVTTTALACLDD